MPGARLAAARTAKPDRNGPKRPFRSLNSISSMLITLSNFAGAPDKSVPIETIVAPNGAGKTTLVNAYYWALVGKTLDGFDVRPAGRRDVVTSVTLAGFAGAEIRRTLTAKGTTLYVNGDAVTQTDFVRAFMERGIDVEFAAACADVNALTSGNVTSDQLRKLLARAGVMDNGEADALRKTLSGLRASRADAERFAVLNVTIPTPTCEPLTRAESEFADRYARDVMRVREGIVCTCPTCGHGYSADKVRKIRAEYYEACARMTENKDENTRIMEKLNAYNAEQDAIEEAQNAVARAQRARGALIDIDEQIATVEAQLREADKNAILADMPGGWSIETDKTFKTSGRTSSTCTLTYNGIPLKSVNRAERVRLVVELLDAARARKGMQAFPIIVDNAESVQSIDVPNVVRLSVG